MDSKAQAAACEALIEEVRRACAESRALQIVLYMLTETKSRLVRNQQRPEFEPVSIYMAVTKDQTFNPTQAGEWVRRAGIHDWWSERTSAFDQELERRGIGIRVRLTTIQGGGRHNPSKHRLDFSCAPVGLVMGDVKEDCASEASLANFDTSPDAGADSSSADSPEDIHILGNLDLPRSPPTLIAEYKRELVRPSWPFRWLLGAGEFESGTWRGGVLLFLVVSMALAWLLPIFWIVGVVIKRAELGHGSLIGVLILVLAWTAVWWPLIRPWLRVARDRVTIAPITYLAIQETVGQIEFVRDRRSRWMGGVVRLARYSAVCPKCSGVIDLTAGRRDFPGRVVGRCADSPMEHVYSFDPVSRTGSPIR